MGYVLWKYLLAWIPMVVIAIANGAMREALFTKRLGELRAHQVSCATGLFLFSLYVWALTRIWPLPSSEQAFTIGLIWLALTVAFEFSFGHFARGLPWSELLHDYDVLAGRLWVLVLVWVTIAPYFFYRLQR